MVAKIQRTMEQITQVQGREINNILVLSTSCLIHIIITNRLCVTALSEFGPILEAKTQVHSEDHMRIPPMRPD